MRSSGVTRDAALLSKMGAIRKLIILAFTLVLSGFLPATGSAAQSQPEAGAYHFLLSFENRTGGEIRLTDLTQGAPGDDNTYVIGHVLRPATAVRELSFHATLWGKSSTVVASAVNAIHIKVFGLAHLDRGSSIAIAPHELFGRSLDGEPEAPVDYTIYTDIESGMYLFGGSFSPVQGARVRCLREGRTARLQLGFAPEIGDVFLIEVTPPKTMLESLTFENKLGGRVEAAYANMTRSAVGKVEKRVTGVGRFPGSYLAPVGSIRASHAGVLDISTSPRGQIGGFQIIPWNHSQSREMAKSRVAPQYMIVDSYGGGELTGVPPLFGEHLFPRVGDRSEPDLVSLSGKRVPVAEVPRLPRVRIEVDLGQGLVPMRSAVGLDDNALLALRRLVIYFEQ